MSSRSPRGSELPRLVPEAGPIEPSVAAQVSGAIEPIVLSRGNSFCVVNRRGDITPPRARDLGLFHEDMRHLSHLELVVTGGVPTVLSAETLTSASSQIDLTLSQRSSEGFFGDPEHSLHIRRRQLLDESEYVERFSATNHLRREVRVELTFQVEADFADIFEIRGARRPHRGTLHEPVVSRDRVVFAYRGVDGALYQTIVRLMPEPTSFEGTAPRYLLQLQPGETTVLELSIRAVHGASESSPEERAWRPFDLRLKALTTEQREFLDRSTRIRCDNNRFETVLNRALSDIHSLRLSTDGRRVVGAGIPWFAAPFGRDAIITSLECLLVAPELACETLRTLAAYQGTRHDPWREEEPGKIFHELRRGEMARAGEVPHSPYYGTIDATPLWLILLGETHRWLGDDALVEELYPNAERALGWMEHRLKHGDGLVRYQRSHTRGLENQGWKDSRDGVSFPDGTIARPPIALVEVQGYVVAAYEAMAALHRRRGDARVGAKLRERAQALRQHIECEYWLESIDYYALAIDGERRRVETITSNPGHLIFCRALPRERANAVAKMLLSEAMYTGWGIRTVARGQAVYNPLSYHNGTVWPHDNALCALGLAQTGHVDQAVTLFEGLYAASLHFRDLRLPELFCGVARGEGDSLVHYPVSCSPQAWASASFFLLLQATLGIRPDAEHNRLVIRNPRLPDFIQRLELERIRVGRSIVSLHFERHASHTHVDLANVEGDQGLKVMIEIG